MKTAKKHMASEDNQAYKILVGVPVMEFYTVEEARQLLHVSRDKVRAWERLEEDPFPVIYLPGRYRGGVIQRDAMVRWVARNGKTVTGGSPEEHLS